MPTEPQKHTFLQFPVGHFRNPDYDNGRCWHVMGYALYCGALPDADIHRVKDVVTEARELIRQMPATNYFVPEKDAAEYNYQLILTMGFTAGVVGRIQVTPFTLGYVPIAQAFARAPELLHQLCDEVEQLRELVVHAHVYSGYPNCGYLQMTTKQKALYDDIWNRSVKVLNEEETKVDNGT